MKCPACARLLTEVAIGAVRVDACAGGCGGIWFDADELERVNQTVPAGQTPLVDIARDPAISVDDQRPRNCPRCVRQILERKLFSLGGGVVMDCCPQCRGVWLDHGEWETIRIETHPPPPSSRRIVRRTAQAVSIDFATVQQVRALRIKHAPRKRS